MKRIAILLPTLAISSCGHLTKDDLQRISIAAGQSALNSAVVTYGQIQVDKTSGK